MQRQHERNLEILTALGEGTPVTQRGRAARHGVGLGLANHSHRRLASLHAAGMKRFAICRVGEAAELAYLTLREFGLEPVGVFDREAGGRFLGFPVRSLAELAQEETDGVIVATFDRPEPHLAELGALGVPAGKCVILSRLTDPVARNERTGR